MSKKIEDEELRKFLEKTYSDSIFNLLIKNSFFTKIQLEALLIDHASQGLLQTKMNSQTKISYRIISSGRTRGSYNRTLRIARKKLEKLFNSLTLIGYIGLIQNEDFEKLFKLAENLKARRTEANSEGFE
ncbi:MAG: hypothetical protein QXI32_01700 [Candidatus Bathyarchaeia archaeon]